MYTFEGLSPESYTGMRIAKEHVRVLYSALSLCTISRRIVQVPNCRGAVKSELAVPVTVYRTTRIILIGHGLWELLTKVI